MFTILVIIHLSSHQQLCLSMCWNYTPKSNGQSSLSLFEPPQLGRLFGEYSSFSDTLMSTIHWLNHWWLDQFYSPYSDDLTIFILLKHLDLWCKFMFFDGHDQLLVFIIHHIPQHHRGFPPHGASWLEPRTPETHGFTGKRYGWWFNGI